MGFSLVRRPVRLACLRAGWPYPTATFMVVWLVTSAPLSFQEDLIPIGHNGDAVSYCVRADYLAANGYRMPPPNHPAFPILAGFMTGLGRRAGDQYLLAALSRLSGKDPFATFSPLINVAHGLAVVGAIYLGWSLLGLGARSRWLLWMVTSFSSTLMWGSYDDFLSQQMVIGALLVSLALFREYLDSVQNSIRVPWRELAAFAAVTSSILSLYPEALSFYVIILGTILLPRLREGGRRLAVGVIVSVMLILAMNPVGMYRWIKGIPAEIHSPELATEATRRTAGNIRYFASPHELFALTPHVSNLVTYRDSYYASFVGRASAVLLLAGSLIVLALGFVRARKADKAVILAIGVSVAAHLIVFRLAGFYYAYMKITTLGVGFAECLLVFSISELWRGASQHRKGWRIGTRGCLAAFMAATVSMHLVSATTVIRRIISTPQSAQAHFRELSAIVGRVNPRASIYLADEFWSARQAWMFYFLQGGNIYAIDSIPYFQRLESHEVAEGVDFVIVDKTWACDAFPAIAYCRDRTDQSGSGSTPRARNTAPVGTVDDPRPEATLRGIASVAGWALHPEDRFLRLVVTVDAEEVAFNPVRFERHDVCRALGHARGCVNSGFRFAWDSATVANGEHALAVHATDRDRNVTMLGARRVWVENSRRMWALKGSRKMVAPVIETEHFLVFAGRDVL